MDEDDGIQIRRSYDDLEEALSAARAAETLRIAWSLDGYGFNSWTLVLDVWPEERGAIPAPARAEGDHDRG